MVSRHMFPQQEAAAYLDGSRLEAVHVHRRLRRKFCAHHCSRSAPPLWRGAHVAHAPASSSSRTSTMAVLGTGSSAASSGSGMELMKGELRMETSGPSPAPVPLARAGGRFVPVSR
jgi:hypothetical protein